jgi:hypothetical protein
MSDDNTLSAGLSFKFAKGRAYGMGQAATKLDRWLDDPYMQDLYHRDEKAFKSLRKLAAEFRREAENVLEEGITAYENATSAHRAAYPDPVDAKSQR